MLQTSVIISTYNQPEFLRLALETLFKQTRLPDEIIVADDGSGNETARTVREMGERSPVPLSHVWQSDEGYRLPASLNNAIGVSSGEYLVFLDGDCYVNEFFIEDHLSRAEPRRFVVGTRVNIRSKRKEHILRSGDSNISVFSWGTSKKLHAIRSSLLSRFRRHGRMAGANFAAWRSDLVAVNGFDERFNGHGGSDADLARRLERAGIALKKMVHLGMAYHFDHPEHGRGDSMARYVEVWDTTPENEKTRCRLGLDRALKEGVTILYRTQ